MLLPLCLGCPVTQSLPDQAAVQELVEPRSDRPYLLYVPSIYSDAHEWPLIVACHGTWPYDDAEKQMREWAKFAEYEGIIIVAPKLNATKGDFPPPPETQIALQRADEDLILAIVSLLKRQYNIASDKIFMTGWSAGAYTILHTGLRNPDVFRALAIRQGSFDERYMDVPSDRMDDWQSIFVIYGMSDFLRDDSKAMLEWLRDKGYMPREREVAGVHRRLDPKIPWGFFKNVLEKRPWITVQSQVVERTDPLTLTFSLDANPPVKRCKWYFGDGADSYEASPTHTYEQQGQYKVTVNVELQNGKKYARTQIVQAGW